MATYEILIDPKMMAMSDKDIISHLIERKHLPAGEYNLFNKAGVLTAVSTQPNTQVVTPTPSPVKAKKAE